MKGKCEGGKKGIQTEKEKKTKEWKIKHLGEPGILNKIPVLDMRTVKEETD